MVKSIRVKRMEKWKDVDRSLISSREFKCLDDGHMVNIADQVAREMIKKGWVINIDPMKEIKTPRSIMEVKHNRPDLPGGVVNPGLQEETDGTGKTKDIPPEGSGEDAGGDGGTGEGTASGEADGDPPGSE